MAQATFKPGDSARALAARNKRRKLAKPAAADPITSDRHYADDEAELLAAMATYKTDTGRMFPTFCEVLAVLKTLGYSKSSPCVDPIPA